MKTKTYKYTVISRQKQWRISLSKIMSHFIGDVTIVHKRTNWRWVARLWAWWLRTPDAKVFVVDGHVETAFKDNQP